MVIGKDDFNIFIQYEMNNVKKNYSHDKEMLISKMLNTLKFRKFKEFDTNWVNTVDEKGNIDCYGLLYRK